MSVHIHTTIPNRSAEILNQLTGTYGTKSRVLEKALETMLRVEKVGSCDDCAFKAQIEEQTKLREALELTSIRKDLLDELLRVALSDITMNEFIQWQRTDAQNTIELVQSSIHWKPPTEFRDFLSLIDQLSEITRLFDVGSHREMDKTVVLRPIIFLRMPELVAFQLAIILEGIGIYFDLRIMRKEIILKMLRKELASARRSNPLQFISERMEEKFGSLKPQLFKDQLVLVGPAFLKWAAQSLEESIADLGAVIEDMRLSIKPAELSDNPKEFIDGLIRAGRNMNWITQVNINQDSENNFRITFQATSPSMANIATVSFALILATKGWKLIRYSTEYDNGSITVEFVGEGSQEVLDQLIEMNLFRVVNQQFLDSIPIPRELLDTFAIKVYDSDRRRFEEIYRNIGFRIANAIRMLAKNDEEKIGRLVRSYIEKNVHEAQPNAELRFVDDETFSVVFRQMEPITITSQQIVIKSILEALGYEVSVTTFQNLLNVKMKKIGKPLLGPLHRSEVVQMVSDAIAADSLKDALIQVKPTLDELFPVEYPWTINEIGDRLLDMYRELGIQVEIEYFEGGFTLKYRTCPYYKLVANNQKTWLCKFRKKAIEYILSRVTRTGKGRIKVIKSLIEDGTHPCEYAIFLEEFLAISPA
ncbi:MAG: hypothetical protein ACFFDJ_04340 [Candidatus Odinarchaeota archaeon]